MPKGGRKRTQAEYEKEIEDAIKRFRKYPDRLQYAGSSEEWQEFLQDIGVYPHTIAAGDDFWEQVRQGVEIDARMDFETTYTDYIPESDYIDYGISVEHYTTKTGKEVTRYRDINTGRFRKGIE